MTGSRPRPLRALRLAGTAVAVVAAAVAVAPGLAAATPAGTATTHANAHAYRHGVVPPRGAHAATSSSTTGNEYYHGGTAANGATVGVTTGPPKVYLLFWGSQWGSQGTNAAGDTTFSGDSAGMAPDLQNFFRGLGTGGELWSGVMTQYCEGVASGASVCPTGYAQVGYPTGGALGGVWVDESTAAPSQASAAQLAQEAMNQAVGHGLTASNSRNDQVFVVSPTGTHPDGFNTPLANFCAWHDHTADPSIGISASYDLAFTNMPYVTDMGTSCGAYFVNPSNGTLDGVTIVGGHEYAETITDQMPNSDALGNITTGGWADSSSAENGDKCAWISSGQGAAANLTLSTGTFAVQSTWANDYNSGAGGCELSHPIVSSATTGSLSFNSAAQSLTAGTVSGPMKVTASSGAPSVALSSSSTGGSFSTTSTGTFTSTLSVPAGTTFYYKDTVAGSPTLTATATGYSSATQTETVAAGALSRVSVSPSSVTLAPNGTQTFTASGADQYGNTVTLSSVSWTVTAGLGSLSSSTGTSTTFTMSSNPNPTSGSVTATSGGLSGSATVTEQTVAPMTVSVTTGTSSYRKGSYKTPITVTATSNGSSVANAAVSLSIYTASGGTCGTTLVTTGSGTTNSNGQSSFTFSTKTYGTYCAAATVTESGYATGHGESAPFTN